MRRVLVAVLAALLLSIGATAHAHRIDETLQATLLTLAPDRVDGAMRIVPGALVSSRVIAAIDRDGDGVFSPPEQQAYARQVLQDLSITIDGAAVRPTLDSATFPSPAQMRAGVGEIHVDFTVALPAARGDRRLVLENRHRRDESVYLVNVLVPTSAQLGILSQQRNPQQSVYELDFRQTAVRGDTAAPTDGIQAGWQGLQLSNLFHLGMRHIADGTDHLLFLLVLLLPAPLTVSRRRWSGPVAPRDGLVRVLGIVTAFTVGHSITLGLAAVGGIAVPGRAVEVLIALSILVSAAHAWRPIFPGREAAIAGAFGLVHGLAFAATLDHLGVGRWERLAGTLAFNAGIEAMQVLVVAAVLPSLLMIGRSAAYVVVRIAGAAFAGAAALGWIIGRLFDAPVPVDTVVDAVAAHGVAIALALLVAALVIPCGPIRARSSIAPGSATAPGKCPPRP